MIRVEEKKIDKQSAIKSTLRKPHRRQVGTLGWVFEKHIEIMRELDKVGMIDDIDPMESLKRIGEASRVLNNGIKVGSVQVFTVNYLPLVAEALRSAASRCDSEEGIPKGLRESWQVDIANLRADNGVEAELATRSEGLTEERLAAARFFYQKVAEIGEPFLREKMKENYIRILRAIPQ